MPKCILDDTTRRRPASWGPAVADPDRPGRARWAWGPPRPARDWDPPRPARRPRYRAAPWDWGSPWARGLCPWEGSWATLFPLSEAREETEMVSLEILLKLVVNLKIFFRCTGNCVRVSFF